MTKQIEGPVTDISAQWRPLTAGLPAEGSEVIAETWDGEMVSARVSRVEPYPYGQGLSGTGLCLPGVDLRAVKRWRLVDSVAGSRADGGGGRDWLREVGRERTRHGLLGYDAAHDDCHRRGELMAMAGCYLQSARGADVSGWPYETRFRSSRYRWQDLVKAGSLILAELERMERAPTAEEVAGY